MTFRPLAPYNLAIPAKESQVSQSSFHRKPIFGNSVIISRIWKRQSENMELHGGDQACPDQIYEVVRNQGKSKEALKQWTCVSSCEPASKEISRSYQNNQNRGIINYSSVKVQPISNKESKQAAVPVNQDQHSKLILQSFASENKIKNLSLQNQMLMNQQFILTQVLLSNQTKLRKLEQMQKLQTLNVDYKKKMYDVKSKLKDMNFGREEARLVKQLLQILSF